MSKRISGFTIVELVIVISVIAILAAITVVAYGGSQDRARAAAVVTGIESIEKSFVLLAADQGRSTWWRDPSSTDLIYPGAPNNPTIDQIIANTGMSKDLSSAPRVSGLNLTWTYDNDGDEITQPYCGMAWEGVVLAIGGVTPKILAEVNRALDNDNDINCGKVRTGNAAGTSLIYQLGSTQRIDL